MIDKISMFDDQLELVNSVRKKVKEGHRAVLMQGATGSGKTRMASDLVRGAYLKGSVCHFVVPRRDLIRQTSEEFRGFNIPHGFIAAGIKTLHRNKIFICSSGTLINQLSTAPDLAIIDETHFGSDGLDRIIKFYKSKKTIIIGLSATPWKLSGQGLGCWYETMVCGPSIRWLIDNKRLSQYRAFAPSHPDLSQIKVTAGDYAKGQLSEKMEGDTVLIGNAVKHYKTHAMGKLGVTFGVSRKHSEMLAQSYRDYGIPAMHMDGDTSDDDRKKIAKAFAKRELLQLTNCDLLNFGYDLASASGMRDVNIQCLTDCKPTKSLAAQMQKNGRNLRYDKKDSDPHLFFDHANNFNEHGLPCADRVWSLEDRKKSYRNSDEREVRVRQCPACFYCFDPAPKCPNCGHILPIQSREIEEIDGELEEIKIIKEREEKKTARMEVGRAKTMADLIRIQQARKYAPGWVDQMAKVKGIAK